MPSVQPWLAWRLAIGAPVPCTPPLVDPPPPLRQQPNECPPHLIFACPIPPLRFVVPAPASVYYHQTVPDSGPPAITPGLLFSLCSPAHVPIAFSAAMQHPTTVSLLRTDLFFSPHNSNPASEPICPCHTLEADAFAPCIVPPIRPCPTLALLGHFVLERLRLHGPPPPCHAAAALASPFWSVPLPLDPCVILRVSVNSAHLL